MCLHSSLSLSGIQAQSSPASETNDIMSTLPSTMTWKLSGSSKITDDGGITTLSIDVTLYSSSTSQRGTFLYFMVKQDNGSFTDVNDISVTGTGTYTYICMNIYGTVDLEARYVSTCTEELEEPHINNMTLNLSSNQKLVTGEVYHPYFSTFGLSSTTISNHFKGYIGYDGNNAIYLANLCKLSTYAVIPNNIILTQVTNHTETGICNYQNYIVGDTSYCEQGNANKLYVTFNLTELGAGRGYYYTDDICSAYDTFCEPSILKLNLQTKGAPCDVTDSLVPNNGVNRLGINVTHANKKVSLEAEETESLMLDGLSYIPPVGYIINTISTAQAAANLVKTITGSSSCIEEDNNKPVKVNENIDNGTLTKNFYGLGLIGRLCIPMQQVKTSFHICITYETKYGNKYSELADSYIQASTAKLNLSASLATEVYNTSIPNSLNGYELYLHNLETDKTYQIVVSGKKAIFFAEPGENYEFYAFKDGSITDCRSISGTSLLEGGNLNLNL